MREGQAATPTLAVAAKLTEQAASRDEYLRLARHGLTRALEAFRSSEPVDGQLFNRVVQVAPCIRDAFASRYGTQLPYTGGSSAAVNLREWLAEAEQLLRELTDSRVPLFTNARAKQEKAFRERCRDVLSRHHNSAIADLNVRFTQLRNDGPAAAHDVLRRVVDPLRQAADRLPSLPPLIGPITQRAVDESRPGLGPVRVGVGHARLGDVHVQLRSPGNQSDSVALRCPDLSLPLVVDLDRSGGLVTDSPDAATAVLLKLLGLLPAGQLKAHLVDPLKLGDSAKALFALDSALETIIGPKVKSTAQELEQVLVELEEHITFVTQKYLQGQYATLTEYNLAAGDVSEPYRVLVLYDFPVGFERAGHTDVDALDRLKKIIGGGARCGVYTLVVSPKRDLLGPLSDLPVLFTSRALAPRQVARWGLHHPGAEGAVTFQWPEASSAAGNPLDRAADGSPQFVGGAAAEWFFMPEPLPEPAAVSTLLSRVQRDLVAAADVRVDAAQVARLATSRLDQEVSRGLRGTDTLPHPDEPSTWWHGRSDQRTAAGFGRVGARDVATLTFDSENFSNALIGGRPGSGKSVLLHSLIAALTTRYGPEELELYLIDFKEGVEFKVYASGGLPHARVVAIESEREFGLSVLQSLHAEITRRGELFRAENSHGVNLGTYRSRMGRPLPRIVLIVDEFHVLFERDDQVASKAAEMLERIVRQGRAFGVHTVLASQTLTGIAVLGQHVLNMVPIRIALQSSDADSRLLLADDNADARLLSRPGEGILNVSGGLKEANVRFQASYWSAQDRETLVERLRGLADAQGFRRRPVVFEGRAPATVAELEPAALAHADGPNLSTPVGMPLTLDGPVRLELRREPGGNVLLVAGEDLAYATLTVLLTDNAARGVHLDVLDYGQLDAPWQGALEVLSDRLRVSRRRTASGTLEEIAELVRSRHELGDFRAEARLVVLAALHRARDFDASDYDAREPQLLETILRDGPDVGVHVAAWCDKAVSLERRLSRDSLREFGIRILGPLSTSDSRQLIDSDLAAQLHPSQAVLDDQDRAVTTRFRRFEMPPSAWVTSTVNRL